MAWTMESIKTKREYDDEREYFVDKRMGVSTY